MSAARALTACTTTILIAACAPIHGTRGTYIDFIRPDQRPPLISAGPIADSLWGPLSESTQGDGISDLRRYHATGVPASGIGRTGREPSFLGLRVGHYFRF